MKYCLMLVVLFFLGCGVDVTGRKFSKEKDDRIEAQKKLGDEKGRNGLFTELISNFVQSETLQWIFINSHTTSSIPNEEVAQGLCQELGYDLPTIVQLRGEGANVEGISDLWVESLPPEHMVYVQGEGTPEEQKSRFLVCVRDIP